MRMLAVVLAVSMVVISCSGSGSDATSATGGTSTSPPTTTSQSTTSPPSTTLPSTTTTVPPLAVSRDTAVLAQNCIDRWDALMWSAELDGVVADLDVEIAIAECGQAGDLLDIDLLAEPGRSLLDGSSSAPSPPRQLAIVLSTINVSLAIARVDFAVDECTTYCEVAADAFFLNGLPDELAAFEGQRGPFGRSIEKVEGLIVE